MMIFLCVSYDAQELFKTDSFSKYVYTSAGLPVGSS